MKFQSLIMVGVFLNLSVFPYEAQSRALSAAELADQRYWEDASQSAELDLSEPSPELESALLGPDPQPYTPKDLPRVQVDVFMRPLGINVRHEFMVVRVDGLITSIRAVSTATLKLMPKTITVMENGKKVTKTVMSKKMTPPGTYTMRPLIHERLKSPTPWKRNAQGSTMYWGLQWRGPYWSHSTPHYKELGKPASLGCVRMSYPTAMELFDLVVNQAGGMGQITIHAPENAPAAFRKLGLDSGYVLDQVESDIADAHVMLKPGAVDYFGNGHARRNQTLVYPRCGDRDCFTSYGVKPRVQ